MDAKECPSRLFSADLNRSPKLWQCQLNTHLELHLLPPLLTHFPFNCGSRSAHQLLLLEYLHASTMSSEVASTSRNPGTAYSASLQEKLVAPGDSTNAFDMYCPLGGCRCLMLRQGSARLVKRSAAAVSGRTPDGQRTG